MTAREKAQKIFDEWADEQGHYHDPVIVPRDKWEGGGGDPWKSLIDKIEKELSQSGN